ncbi:hypothetical protein GUJ93_ZPchr0458g22490 [Zizania palustris]|uniref:Uncharacterized protein n=1 Tax=Zizania palustris TaxID=103762 RepID=A0A8J5RBX7_ZIZPA|nr:hypothetical protein GUJ93_ZPchr0458g22490 [Zizania palustris]
MGDFQNSLPGSGSANETRPESGLSVASDSRRAHDAVTARRDAGAGRTAGAERPTATFTAYHSPHHGDACSLLFRRSPPLFPAPISISLLAPPTGLGLLHPFASPLPASSPWWRSQRALN